MVIDLTLSVGLSNLSVNVTHILLTFLDSMKYISTFYEGPVFLSIEYFGHIPLISLSSSMWIYPYFCQFPYSPHLLLVKTIKQAYIINFSNLQWRNFSLIQPFKLFLNLLYSFNFTIQLTTFPCVDCHMFYFLFQCGCRFLFFCNFYTKSTMNS